MAVSSVSSSGSSTGSISFGGLASGLPADMVDQLMKAQQSRLNTFQNDKQKLADQKSAYGDLQSKLSALSSKIAALKDASSWAPHTVTSSLPDKVSATASNAATAGSHAIRVAQLATNDTFVLGDDTLTPASGVSSANDTLKTGSNFTFTYNGVKYGTGADTPTSGFADLSGKTLSEVASMINGIDYGSKAGVSASVMQDGASFRLVLTARDSGRNDGAARLSIDGATSLAFESGTTLTTFKNTVPAQNAIFNLDGVNVVSTSNTPSDVLTGVTLQLKTTTAGTTAKDTSDPADGINDAIDQLGSETAVISVGNDTSTVKANLNSFVDAYNAVVDFVNKNKDGPLANSSMARNVVAQLRSVLNVRTNKVGAATASDFLTRGTLAEYGMRTDSKTGLISFVGTTLDNALQNDYNSLAALFTNTQAQVGTGKNAGLSTRFQTLLSAITNGVTGSLTTQTRGIDTRMTRLDKDITRENSRLDAVRKQLTDKFSNLEQMVGKLNSAGSAMTSALSKM
ncbi:MAG: flagellar filament capping protein FliD [Magnetococcus sp. YQC-3]